jgi:nucleoside 2-deoxyribosyltransferase
MKLYFAGPLFTTAERDFNAALAAQLRRAGHEVFLPQEAEQRNATAGALVGRCGIADQVSSAYAAAHEQ